MGPPKLFTPASMMDCRNALWLCAVCDCRDRLSIKGVVDLQTVNAMSRLAQLPGEIAHCDRDRREFLSVMKHIVGFLPDFHQNVDDVGTSFVQPGVFRIELVAQSRAKRDAGPVLGHDGNRCRDGGRVHLKTRATR